jgi:hypothetical protein
MHTKFWSENLNHGENLGIGWRIVLEWILEE